MRAESAVKQITEIIDKYCDAQCQPIEIGPLPDQLTGSLSAFIADGAYDQDRVYAAVADRYPGARVIVPPRITAVLSVTAETMPTQQVWRSHRLRSFSRETTRAGRRLSPVKS